MIVSLFLQHAKHPVLQMLLTDRGRLVLDPAKFVEDGAECLLNRITRPYLTDEVQRMRGDRSNFLSSIHD